MDQCSKFESLTRLFRGMVQVHFISPTTTANYIYTHHCVSMIRRPWKYDPKVPEYCVDEENVIKLSELEKRLGRRNLRTLSFTCIACAAHAPLAVSSLPTQLCFLGHCARLNMFRGPGTLDVNACEATRVDHLGSHTESKAPFTVKEAKSALPPCSPFQRMEQKNMRVNHC